MTQEKTTVQRGRPIARKETSPAPEAAPKKAVKSKKSTIKRTLPNEEKLPKLYETVNGRGGVYFKLRSSRLTIYDKETGQRRAIRYCPGEPSIYVDEQSDQAIREHVIFRNKMLFVKPDQPNLIEFLNKHPDNTANGGGSFQLIDKTVDVEKEIEDEFLVHDAISLIKARPIEELLPIAMSLKINTNQKDLQLKRALVLYAKKKPQTFIEMFDNPLVHARTSVMQAMDFQIISEKKGVIVWSDTGKLVVSVPVGQDAIDTMTRFCLTDKGSSVLNEINRQLEEIA